VNHFTFHLDHPTWCDRDQRQPESLHARCAAALTLRPRDRRQVRLRRYPARSKKLAGFSISIAIEMFIRGTNYTKTCSFEMVAASLSRDLKRMLRLTLTYPCPSLPLHESRVFNDLALNNGVLIWHRFPGGMVTPWSHYSRGAPGLALRIRHNRVRSATTLSWRSGRQPSDENNLENYADSPTSAPRCFCSNPQHRQCAVTGR